jgi:ribose 5-phosphate isomerase B
MTLPPLAVASDHGGVDLKTLLIADLPALGWSALDLGTHGPDSVDYPVFANALAAALAEGRATRGLLICGTGIGISIAANRFAHIRAALVHDAFGAAMCRRHNDANVLVLGGRTIGIEVARDCLRIFLETPFEGGRHARRVAMLGERGER